MKTVSALVLLLLLAISIESVGPRADTHPRN